MHTNGKVTANVTYKLNRQSDLTLNNINSSKYVPTECPRFVYTVLTTKRRTPTYFSL